MKMLIIIGTIVTTIAAGSLAAGIVSYNSCGYDPETGNYLYDGNKVAAYGTMDSAMECALQGILPTIVANRLGVWGDAETKEEAEEILLMDGIKKIEKEREKKE